MKQLRVDFEKVKVLCELIIKREDVNATMVELTNDYFEERIFGLVDTTGMERPMTRSSLLNKRKVEEVLNGVPGYFEDGPIVKVRGGKKRKRNVNNAADSRDPSPVPPVGAAAASLGPLGTLHPSNNPAAAANNAMANLPPGMKQPHPPGPGGPMLGGVPLPPMIAPFKNTVVAGHDGGWPAPSFLQPLATRESHPVTSWEDAVPSSGSFTSFVNGQEASAANQRHRQQSRGAPSFRHRPRLGRGGRIVIDRVPTASTTTTSFATFHHHPHGPSFGSGNVIPPQPNPVVITYGAPMPRSGYDIAPLGTDGPNYTLNSSPDKFGPNRSPLKRKCDGRPLPMEEGRGTDANSAPKAPPARSLEDLLPKSLGDTRMLSRKIEEICALGLMEDRRQASKAAVATKAGAVNASSSAAAASSKVGGSSSAAALDDELDEVLVPIEDWMEAPGSQKIYGVEQFVVGPL